MGTPATLSQPVSARTQTNAHLATEEWAFTFFELSKPALATAEAPDRQAEETVSIASVDEQGRDKWLYVFLATLNAAGSITRTSLQYEGQYDDDGALRLVDWKKKGRNEWTEAQRAEAERTGQEPAHRYASLDVRPTQEAPVPGGVLTLTLRADGSADETASRTAVAAGSRSVYLAFLSHVQLPAARLAQYFGTDAHELLRNRSLLLDPHTKNADGDTAGYGPSMADAERQGQRMWLHVPPTSPPERRTAQAVLLDYVDWADQLQQKYEAALEPLQMYDFKNAEKTFYASITESITRAYAAQETGGQLSEVPGHPMRKIWASQVERNGLKGTVDRWAEALYGTHMRQPGYRLASADAADPETAAELTDEHYLRIEDEVERQLQILDGAELSEAGLRYLRDEVERADATPLLVWFAKSEAFLTKLSLVPLINLRYAFKEPWAASRKVIKRDIGELNKRRMGFAGDLNKYFEHVRAQRGVLDGVKLDLRRTQADVLGALAHVETNEQTLESLRAAREARLAERRANADAFEALAGRDQGGLRPGVRLLTTDEVVAQGDGAVRLFEPRSLRPGFQPSFDNRVETFRFRGSDYAQNADGIYELASGNRSLVGRSGRTLADGDALRAMAVRDIALDDAIGEIEREMSAARRTANASRQNANSVQGHADARVSAYFHKLKRLTDLDDEYQTAQRGLSVTNVQVGIHQANVDGLVAQSDAAIEKMVTSRGAKLAFGLTAIGLGLSAWDFVSRMSDDTADAWGIYDEAFLSAVGTVGAIGGTVDALEIFSRKVAFGVRNRVATRVLVKGMGAIGGACAVWVGIAEFRQAREDRDVAGQLSAGFAIASGIAATIAGAGAALGFLGPVGVAIWGAIALSAAIVSIFLWLFTDTPLETWFKKNRWRMDAPPIGEMTPALSQRMERDLTDLLKLISMPVISAELWDVGGTSMASFGTGTDRDAPPHLLRIAVRPGFRTPGMTYAVSGLRLRVDEWGADPVWNLQTTGGTISIPNPAYALYTPNSGENRAVYLQELQLDYAHAPRFIVEALSSEPTDVEFECSVALVPPGGRGDGAEVTFHLRGGVGYVRRSDASDYAFNPYSHTVSPTASDGPRVSVGLPVSD